MRYVFVLALLPLSLFADEKEPPKEPTPAQAELLAKQKFVQGDREFKQVFSAYIGSDLPVFITADSLLNAFHVVFEESIYRLEKTNAQHLPAYLKYVVEHLDEAAKGLDAPPEMLATALQKARLYLGTAWRLHDPTAGTFDDTTTALIKVELETIHAAKGSRKPYWLGKPDPGFLAIDYTRFKPRGFYTRHPDLQRYFRIVSWLQAVPFRITKDDELLAALIMARAATVPDDDKHDTVKRGQRALECFERFLGTPDDNGLQLLQFHPPKWADKPWKELRSRNMLEWVRNEIGPNIRTPKVNDQLAVPKDGAGTPEPSVRVAALYCLPDAALFSKTTAPNLKRAWPTGLEVAAALDSPFATKQLPKGIADLVEKHKQPLFMTYHGNEFELRHKRDYADLYTRYLFCLGTLLYEKEPDWPAFMKSDTWQVKNGQTALSSWAQMRHTWVLQAKLNELFLSGAHSPKGFVEPVPAFYHQFVELCWEYQNALKARGVFEQPRLTESERDIQKLMQFGGYSSTLDELWDELRSIAHQLESLSHKQLRKRPFTHADERFIGGYGIKLAKLFFYDGNSYFEPRDDAPRIVDIFTNRNEHLEVGIGRARSFYVLYPWDGKEVLCRGAVLPYYEFTHGERLDDSQWKKLLDSPQRPKQPAWTKTLTGAKE